MCKEYFINDTSELVKELKIDFMNMEISPYDSLRFQTQYIKEPVTVRFKPGVIRYPFHPLNVPENMLDFIETREDDPDYQKKLGSVLIPKIGVGTVLDPPKNIATLQGFDSNYEL